MRKSLQLMLNFVTHVCSFGDFWCMFNALVKIEKRRPAHIQKHFVFADIQVNPTTVQQKSKSHIFTPTNQIATR